MKWFRKSNVNGSTAGCTGNAQCTMHNAQLRKMRTGRGWGAAAAAWVLAVGTLLGSAGVAKATDTTGGRVYFDATGWDNPTYVYLCIGHSSYSSGYRMTRIANTQLYYYDMPSWGGHTYVGFLGNATALTFGDNKPFNTVKTSASYYTGTTDWGFNIRLRQTR